MEPFSELGPWLWVFGVAATLIAIGAASANRLAHAKRVHMLRVDVRRLRREYATRIGELDEQGAVGGADPAPGPEGDFEFVDEPVAADTDVVEDAADARQAA